MPSYLTTAGDTVTFPEPAPAVADFLARAHAAAADPAVTVAQMVELVYGPENPILARVEGIARPVVTPAVWADPVFRVLADLVGVKRIQAGHVDPAAVAARHTVTVTEAAEQLGVTGAAVRAAIAGGRLSGQLINGQWYLCPEAVASFRVSTRGRKAMGEASSAGESRREAVVVKIGGVTGATLGVRCDGETLPAGSTELPDGWTTATVRIVGEKREPRTFQIEPAAGAAERIHVGPFEVRGPFRIVKRFNSAKAATEAWEAARG